MNLVLYGIPNCDTCRRARRFLDERGVAYRFHDLRQDGLDQAMVRRWLERVEADHLVNRRSTTWRQLDDTERAQAHGTGLPALLERHPTLVKRPVLETPTACIAGFREREVERLLAGGGS